MAGWRMMRPIRPVRLLGDVFRRRITRAISGVPLSTVVAGCIGVFIGLVAAALIAVPLSFLPDPAGAWLPLAMLVVSLVGSIAVALVREQELLRLLRLMPDGERSASPASGGGCNSILLDTSAIIDGRIADVNRTGFIHHTLIVPRFVLDELRHIADSPEAMKRTRGRRGLDVLTRMQRESGNPIEIVDSRTGDADVDGELIDLARRMPASILTTDFNLNRVAAIQGVKVLNINDLANALRPVLVPGEAMYIRIVQDGKEAGQGLGFLDDGTMVVVEGGRPFIGSDTEVTVTRVLQTSAGRIIFAQLKATD
ncbi:MAG: PIN domain nuclease [Chloroflexi bacterium]|nr:PIN domain nuclease [Chloroflexota bacterium]